MSVAAASQIATPTARTHRCGAKRDHDDPPMATACLPSWSGWAVVPRKDLGPELEGLLGLRTRRSMQSNGGRRCLPSRK